jgi:hypothetical protein
MASSSRAAGCTRTRSRVAAPHGRFANSCSDSRARTRVVKRVAVAVWRKRDTLLRQGPVERNRLRARARTSIETSGQLEVVDRLLRHRRGRVRISPAVSRAGDDPALPAGYRRRTCGLAALAVSARRRERGRHTTSPSRRRPRACETRKTFRNRISATSRTRVPRALLCSIFSSSTPSTPAMRRCSSSAGRAIRTDCRARFVSFGCAEPLM